MNDERLTRLLRSLDEPAEPNPAFAESLFARLEGEVGRAAARRQTSVRWVLLAAMLLLVAALGAAVAVGTGLLKVPAVVSVASPLPLPSASNAQTPTPAASIPEPTTIDKVIATHDGFLAIGSASTDNGKVDVLLQAPGDGSTWQPIDAPDFGRIIDAAAGPSSEIILANASEDLSGKYIVWRSTNGQNWTPDATWTTEANPQPFGTAAGPAGFIILGSSISDSTVHVWTSSDANTWQHATIGPNIDGALVLNAGFLAYSRVDRKVYGSADGVAWQLVSSPVNASGNQWISSIFTVGPNVVALACSQVEPTSCSVWSSTLQGSAGSLSLTWTAASDAQLMNGYWVTAAAGSTDRGFMWGFDLTTYGRVAWTSSDGTHWSRSALADAALGGGMPTTFAAGPTAAVAVGWTEGTPIGPGRELWLSADGISWNPANAPLVPPPPQEPPGPCPSAPTTLQQLLDIGPVKAASCFGQTSLTVSAYSSDCGGCGGTGFPSHSPDWIAAAYAPWYVSTTPTTPGGPGTRMGVWPLPSAHLTPPSEGTQVEITGHFNDPVSPECRIIPSNGGQELPPPSVGEAGCRQAFVVTAFTIAGG